MRVHPDLHRRAGPPLRLTRHRPPLASLSNVWSTVTSHKGSRHRLLVSPFVFVCCWWFIAAMHFFNGTLAFVFSVLYLFFSLPAVYPTVAVVEVSLPVLKVSGWAYMIIALVHWFALGRIVWRSLRARKLTFTSVSTRILASKHSQSSWSRFLSHLASIQRTFWRPWNVLFGVEGIFGVNGRYFYIAFLAREILEVGLQTYQAYQLSGSVRRAWITDLAVGVIVVNSVSTPLVYAVLHRHQESARRFMSLLVDMSLDFCCAAVIPLCVVVPYIAAYDISIGSMPLTRTFDDVWFASSLIEIRQFCVTSLLDFASTMLPQATVFACLNLAQKLVRRDTGVGVFSSKRRSAKRRRVSMSIVVAPEASLSSLVHNLGQSSHSSARSSTLHRFHTMFHALIILWSASILSIHLRASSHADASTVEGCRLSLNAWLVVGTPCSVMQINCYHRGLHGSADEIANLLRPLDRSVLRKLILTHCDSLEIPPLLGEFTDMTDLGFYNVTLVSWPIEAAATPSTMKSLVNVNWFASPFIRFPAGLLHNNLPKGFSRFSIARSNVSELPPNLGALWTHTTLDLFSLQFTEIDHLPSSFSELKASKIRLISNRISLIDDHAFASKQLLSLHLSGNPLESLPASIGDTTRLTELYAEHTNITTVSTQVLQWWNRPLRGLMSHHSFSMYGSPFCDSTPDAAFCLNDNGNVHGTYPWYLIEPQRALEE